MCDGKFNTGRAYNDSNVIQAVPGNNYNIYLYMENGNVREFSAKDLIFNSDGSVRKGTVFAPLSDKQVFKNTLTVIMGMPAWDLEGNRDESKMIDFAPCSLENIDIDYPIVPDPLELENWKEFVLNA